MDIGGRVAPGFEGIREVAGAILAEQGGGLSIAASVDGEVVCDLWGGSVGERTLVHTWSVIKPVSAATLLLACRRASLPLDTPVRAVWPELRAAADGRLTLAGLLAHRAGLATLPGGDVRLLLDPDAAAAALERAEPDWAPGTAAGEHALTYGLLVEGALRRIDGRSVGRFLADEIAGPLGLEVRIGLDADAPVADLEGADEAWWRGLCAGRPPLLAASLGSGVSPSLVNGEAWRRAEIAAVNGHATARGIAGFWAWVRSGPLWEVASRPSGPPEPDLVLGRPIAWTPGSAQVDPGEVGMGGVGGSVGSLRPELGLAWAFLTTVMGTHDRAERLERALLDALAR